MFKQKGFADAETVGVLGIISFVLVMAASWLTHIVVCLSAGKWGFLIAGAILFPIANIHGIGYWFGYFH